MITFLSQIFNKLVKYQNYIWGQFGEKFQIVGKRLLLSGGSCSVVSVLDVTISEHKKSGTEEADLLEVILPTLERVLQYLPDKINDLWHFHGIGKIKNIIQFCL